MTPCKLLTATFGRSFWVKLCTSHFTHRCTCRCFTLIPHIFTAQGVRGATVFVVDIGCWHVNGAMRVAQRLRTLRSIGLQPIQHSRRPCLLHRPCGHREPCWGWPVRNSNHDTFLISCGDVFPSRQPTMLEGHFILSFEKSCWAWLVLAWIGCLLLTG